MSAEKDSMSQVWADRFDDRDDEELQREMWARSLAAREKAMAQPFKNFSFDDLKPSTEREGPSVASEK
ncbi:hypothetical protein [Caenimonas aquaedulcis]|uniref:Uncharacterized protein n=1 Tax=Caenimonas aquaedulcis TaxID=2793270 RepID=A0A931MFZ9_9BURK|nr:hypothetical protein [Caenimonas aquaedulcis]MBG9387766.1 hypothetical protein [Caenimonas aquaedulcis]